MRRRLRVGIASAVIAAFAAGCADDGRPDAGSRSTTGTIEPSARACVAPTFEVDYPDGWQVNSADEAAPCRWFHPRPFELPEATDAVALAVHLRYEPRTVDQLAADAERDEVIDRREATIHDRRAVRIHLRASGAGLLPAGAEMVSWYLDTGPRALVATTTSAADGVFDDNVAVLDAMIASIRTSLDVACSAVGLDVRSSAGDGVPEPVARTREDIASAAVACDYSRLGELARRGNQTFSFSFGGGADPTVFWRDAERSGDEPLRLLVQVLGLSHAERRVDDGRHFIWPAAHNYDSWDDVAAEHRAELRRLYRPDVIESYERAGAYLGHRVGIDDAGEWLFFIAGD